jgi:hypothetical protein
MQETSQEKENPLYTSQEAITSEEFSQEHTQTRTKKETSTQMLSDRFSLAPDLLVNAQDTFSHTSVQQTFSEEPHKPRRDPPENPGPDAKRCVLLEYIKQQLDCYGKEPLLMDKYQLLGPDQRATGGAFSWLSS